MSRKSNVIKYHKRIDINVGFVVFVIIFFYLIISVILYASSKKTTIYEVNTGSLSLNNVYTGFILRDESLVKSDYSGTVNYFVSDGDVADATTVIYTVDETGHVSELLSQYVDSSIDDKELSDIKDSISDYMFEYTNKNFNSIYSAKSAISNKINTLHYNIVLEDLDDLIEKSGNSALFHKVTAERTGMIFFTRDGYENFSEDNINSSVFDKTDYNLESMVDATIINKGDYVYKVINSDEWYVYITLDDTSAATLEDKNSVNVKFVDSDITTPAGISIIRKDDNVYAKLSFNKYLINFANQRYVNIELVETGCTGIKIPVTSVFQKSFYTIPIDYLNEDSNSFVHIYYTSDGHMQTEEVKATIYSSDDEYYYVSTGDFDSGDIIMNDKEEQYIIGTLGELTGVYCVNKGYAVFKEVNILDKNDEYYIVQKGNNYGLKVYDHIVLDYKTVKENELIN